MKRITGIWILLALFAAAAFADIAKPNKSPKTKASIDTMLRINLKEDAKEARLIIPKSKLAQLRAALDQMDDPGDSTAAITSDGIARTQTIVSGLFLSLAIVFGGIWFARAGKISTKAGTALMLVAVIAGAAATFVYGNAGPPPEARSITGKMFSQGVHWYNFGSGKIKLETSDSDRDEIELIVPNPKDDPKPAE